MILLRHPPKENDLRIEDFATLNITGNRLEEHTDCESLTREVVCDFARCNIHHLPTCKEDDVRMQHGFST